MLGTNLSLHELLAMSQRAIAGNDTPFLNIEQHSSKKMIYKTHL